MGKSIEDKLGIKFDSFEDDDQIMLPDPIDTMVVYKGVSLDIKKLVESGKMDEYDVTGYSFKTLRKVMEFYRIPGRSQYTTKEDMAERIVDFIRNELGKPKPAKVKKEKPKSFREIVETLPDTSKESFSFVRELLNNQLENGDK